MMDEIKIIPPLYKFDSSFPFRDKIESDDNQKPDPKFLKTYLSNTTIPWKSMNWSDIVARLPDQWLNVEKPMTADQFDGKLTIIDFFTYCCINCMHILPYLKQLEDRYEPYELQIIGVHSAKFLNERSSANVANAVSRYEIEHPVVNDGEMFLWRTLDVRCWPTLAVIGPDGRLIFWFEGERYMEKLEGFIGRVLDYYREKGVLKSDSSVLEKQVKNLTSKTTNEEQLELKFPAKLAISPSKRLLAVSDSGHHRILIIDLSVEKGNRILLSIGQKGYPGSTDDDFSSARFRSPQGLCWFDEETIFVADTENHLIRKIDISKTLVSTVGGVGQQGQDRVGGKLAHEQAISSPWDLIMVEFEPGNRSLIIAAAGTHQIWILPLTKMVTIGKRQFEPNRLYCFAGTGTEAAKNNSYPQQAAFAQPSGLCVGGMPNTVIYVADSESSSIRSVELKTGAVKNVVGGDMNPENLFAFGDIDGIGFDVKLQHPLGVAYCQENGMVYVADTYNHKIKIIDPAKRTCQALPLNFIDTTINKLNEPDGICVFYPKLYVADTNNHRILVMDLEKSHIEELQLSTKDVGKDTTDNSTSKETVPNSTENRKIIKIALGEKPLKIRIRLNKKDDEELNTDAPHGWKIICKEAKVKMADHQDEEKLNGELKFVQGEAILPDLVIKVGNEKDINLFHLDLIAYVCNKKSGLCSMRLGKYVFMKSEKSDDKVALVLVDL